MTELPSTWDGPDHRRVLADRKRQAAKRALGKPTIKDAAVGPTALLDPALVSAARSDAETAADQLRKGDEVIIVGRLRQRKYTTRDGSERTVFEVDVDTLGKTLRSLAPRQTTASASADPWAGSTTAAAPF